METINERLAYAREKLAGYKSARDFALKHNIPEGTYQSHERPASDPQSRNPKQHTVRKYAELLKVNFIWLWTGHGVPRDIDYNQPEKSGGMGDAPYTGKVWENKAQKNPALTVAEKITRYSRFIELYESLPESQRKAVDLIVYGAEGELEKKIGGTEEGLSGRRNNL